MASVKTFYEIQIQFWCTPKQNQLMDKAQPHILWGFTGDKNKSINRGDEWQRFFLSWTFDYLMLWWLKPLTYIWVPNWLYWYFLAHLVCGNLKISDVKTSSMTAIFYSHSDHLHCALCSFSKYKKLFYADPNFFCRITAGDNRVQLIIKQFAVTESRVSKPEGNVLLEVISSMPHSDCQRRIWLRCLRENI